jgi:hypothetical protein
LSRSCRFEALRQGTHRGNIQRYRHLLETSLTDLEREFVSKGLAEELSALEMLSAAIPTRPS